MTRPGNALGVSVLNLPVGGDAALANSAVSITGLPDINWRDIVAYDVEVFSAGVLQQEDVDFTGFTPVIGQAYKILVKYNIIRIGVAELPTESSITKIVVASTVTLIDLIDDFVTAINNDLQAKVTATRNANVLELNQDDFTIDGFNVPEFPIGITGVTTNTAFVKPAGSPALVAEFVDSSVVITGTEFRKYELTVHKRKEFDSDGDVSSQKLRAIVFADELAGGFAAFDTALTAIVDGTDTPAEYIALV